MRPTRPAGAAASSRTQATTQRPSGRQLVVKPRHSRGRRAASRVQLKGVKNLKDGRLPTDTLYASTVHPSTATR